jgi:nucleoside-diphosphate-sugar epimerase
MNALLVLGYGYSARAIARDVRGLFAGMAGTVRSPQPAAGDMKLLPYDGRTASAELADILSGATHLLVSIPADESGDPFLQHNAPLLSHAPKLRWIGYLSTVGVYGDHGGAWIDEATVCRPVSARSLARVEAERQWLDAAAARQTPLSIFRLAGIYGPGRNAFVNLERGTAHRIVKPGQVFNRIHVDDIALAVSAAMNLEAGGIFNVADDEPAPPQDVVAEAARLMEAEPPPDVPFEQARLSPMARSFYGENKRVSNARMKSALGVTLEYPTYREGLAALWADGSWRVAKMANSE